ncbi:agamous-like MADS-box protein AGL86 [Salvia divinorum]|uniref:Agamous-like MADS-box protein AGL86 n=1 Tax=Salvia divinorum TaxID=28513 RepID=A0ABD1ICI1_SALDI
MGHVKLKLQFIENRKSRLFTLKRRKEGLEKKLDELTTLCDVPACMIIHDPFTNSTYIWPDDSAQVCCLIDSYKNNPSAVKACGLSDFFNKNAEEELVKKNAESKYPTWEDHRLDLMDESQLRELSVAVRAEAEAVRSRIDILKREAMMNEENSNNNAMLDLEEIADQDEIFSIGDGMAATNAQLNLNLNLPQPLKREAMMKKNSNNVVIDLDEFEEIVDRDEVFSIADVMAANANDCAPSLNQNLPPPLKREAMMKNNNSNVVIDLADFEDIADEVGSYSIADVMAANANDCAPSLNLNLNLPPPLKREAMRKNNNNVVIDLDDFEDIVDEDGSYSIADAMAVAMSANAQLPVPDYYCLPQDYIFSVSDVMAAMSANRQLPLLPGYYCPPLLQTFMDHNHLNHGYCSSMDVNWFAGDDGGD